jgi:FkbM family methyltransferase
VRVNNFALSNASGNASLFKVSGNSGLNSLTKRRLDHFDVQMNDIEEIRTITLDEYVSENNINNIDLLKIDVEGHELDVLNGASGCLKDSRIRCIQFEFGGCNIDTRVFFQDFWYLLVEKYSFSLYRITPLGSLL